MLAEYSSKGINARNSSEGIKYINSFKGISGRGRKSTSTFVARPAVGLAVSVSEQLDRIDIQGPAHPPCAVQLLELGQPRFEETMQRAAVGAFDEQLRMVAAGAFGHRRGHRAQQLHAARRFGEFAGLR